MHMVDIDGNPETNCDSRIYFIFFIYLIMAGVQKQRSSETPQYKMRSVIFYICRRKQPQKSFFAHAETLYTQKKRRRIERRIKQSVYHEDTSWPLSAISHSSLRRPNQLRMNTSPGDSATGYSMVVYIDRGRWAADFRTFHFKFDESNQRDEDKLSVTVVVGAVGVCRAFNKRIGFDGGKRRKMLAHCKKIYIRKCVMLP